MYFCLSNTFFFYNRKSFVKIVCFSISEGKRDFTTSNSLRVFRIWKLNVNTYFVAQLSPAVKSVCVKLVQYTLNLEFIWVSL